MGSRGPLITVRSRCLDEALHDCVGIVVRVAYVVQLRLQRTQHCHERLVVHERQSVCLLVALLRLVLVPLRWAAPNRAQPHHHELPSIVAVETLWISIDEL